MELTKRKDDKTGQEYWIASKKGADLAKEQVVIIYWRGDFNPASPFNGSDQGLPKHVSQGTAIIIDGQVIEDYVLICPLVNKDKWTVNVLNQHKAWVEANFKISLYIGSGYSLGAGALLNASVDPAADHALKGRKFDYVIAFNGWYNVWPSGYQTEAFDLLAKSPTRFLLFGGKNDTNNVTGPSMKKISAYFIKNPSSTVDVQLIDGDHTTLVNTPNLWNTALGKVPVLKAIATATAAAKAAADAAKNDAGVATPKPAPVPAPSTAKLVPKTGTFPAPKKTEERMQAGINLHPWTLLKANKNAVMNLLNETNLNLLEAFTQVRIYVTGDHALDQAYLPFGLVDAGPTDWNNKTPYNKWYFGELAKAVKDKTGYLPIFCMTIPQKAIADAWTTAGKGSPKGENIPVFPVNADQLKVASYAKHSESYRFVRYLPEGTIVQVDNEMNRNWYKDTRGIQSGAAYAAEFVAAAAVIKQENPKVKIAAGCIATGKDAWAEDIKWLQEFITTVYQLSGGKIPFDFLTFNYYGKKFKECALAVKEVAWRYANDVPVICTEHGFDTDPKSPLTAGNEAGQATELLSNFKKGAEAGLYASCIYALFNEDGTTSANISEQFRSAGVLESSTKPKAAYNAILKLTKANTIPVTPDPVPPVVISPIPEVPTAESLVKSLFEKIADAQKILDELKKLI